jgi:hypothetical protein
VAIAVAFADDAPIFQPTNPATDRAPVAPHNPSRSTSATISTMRPSIALTRQLSQLPEQPLKTPISAGHRGF